MGYFHTINSPYHILVFLGTNDKAGGPSYLLRFNSPVSVKETSVPLREWKYPYMEQ